MTPSSRKDGSQLGNQGYVTSTTADQLHKGVIATIPYKRLHLTKNGMTVAYGEFGDSTSPHVVFFNHGLPGSRIFEDRV